MRSYAACEDYGGPPPSLDGLPLFAPPEVRKLARRTDPDTSKAAALRLVDGLNALQQRVLTAFQEHGAMSAKQAEQRPEFSDLGFSTVRKRISELASRSKLLDTGRIQDGCTVYECRKEEIA